MPSQLAKVAMIPLLENLITGCDAFDEEELKYMIHAIGAAWLEGRLNELANITEPWVTARFTQMEAEKEQERKNAERN